LGKGLQRNMTQFFKEQPGNKLQLDEKLGKELLIELTIRKQWTQVFKRKCDQQ